MSIKHTPGPWYADLRERYTLGGDMVEITLHDENEMVIDQIASIMLETGEDSPDDQRAYREQEANARLIAAAPDLLAACKEMLNEIRAYQGESEFEEGSITKSHCDLLKSAIAKAEGAP